MNAVIIDHINQSIKKLFDNYPGSKYYGLAQSVLRGTELLPCTVDKYGEGKYIGIDTTIPIQLYHKQISLTTTIRPSSGYGDDLGDYQNVYNNTMVVYLNRTKTNLLPDEFYLYVQANFLETIDIPDFFSVIIRPTSVILNRDVVLSSEYGPSAPRLGAEHHFFAINYTIESVFNKNCFEKCP